MRSGDLRRLLGVTERALSRFDQDRRSARMIGELAVSELRRRLADRIPATRTARGVPEAPQDLLVTNEVLDTDRESTYVDIHPLSLLGVSDLLAAIEEMAPDDLESFRRHEESGRRRPAVLAAIDRRMSRGAA
jgi:hypothetical protein